MPGPPPISRTTRSGRLGFTTPGNDVSVDSLAVIGRLIEEFMDLPPLPTAEILGIGIGHDPVAEYNQKRTRLNAVLEEHGFRYFRGGRVIPNDVVQSGSDAEYQNTGYDSSALQH